MLPVKIDPYISTPPQVVGQSLQIQLATTLEFIENAVNDGDVLIEGQHITPELPLSSISSEKDGELRFQFAVRQVKFPRIREIRNEI